MIPSLEIFQQKKKIFFSRKEKKENENQI